MSVGNDGVAAIDGAMVEVEEALRLAVANHVAGVGVGAADLDFFGLRLACPNLQLALAVRRAVLADRFIQLRQVAVGIPVA